MKLPKKRKRPYCVFSDVIIQLQKRDCINDPFGNLIFLSRTKKNISLIVFNILFKFSNHRSSNTCFFLFRLTGLKKSIKIYYYIHSTEKILSFYKKGKKTRRFNYKTIIIMVLFSKARPVLSLFIDCNRDSLDSYCACLPRMLIPITVFIS